MSARSQSTALVVRAPQSRNAGCTADRPNGVGGHVRRSYNGMYAGVINVRPYCRRKAGKEHRSVWHLTAKSKAKPASELKRKKGPRPTQPTIALR